MALPTYCYGQQSNVFNMFLQEDAFTCEQPSQCQSKFFNVYANQSRSHQPFSLFTIAPQLKRPRHEEKKNLLSNQRVPNSLSSNIYSQQNGTDLDTRLKRADLQNYVDLDFTANIYNPWIWNCSLEIYASR